MKTEKVVVSPRRRGPWLLSTLKRWVLFTQASQCLAPGWTAKVEAQGEHRCAETREMKKWTPQVRGTCGTPGWMIHLRVVNARLPIKMVTTDSRLVAWQQCENEAVLGYSKVRSFGIKLRFETYFHLVPALWFQIKAVISLRLHFLILARA